MKSLSLMYFEMAPMIYICIHSKCACLEKEIIQNHANLVQMQNAYFAIQTTIAQIAKGAIF